MAFRSEFGILSRPASPLASLPPELEVPLPLVDRAELPVVVPEFGDADRFAELAAGSPVAEPRPRAPSCAWTRASEAKRAAHTITVDFMGPSS